MLAKCLVWYVRSSNQELVYYEFYKNNIVSYTIVAVEETLNLALDNSFSLELSLIVPVKAKAALYWIDSSFWWKDKL